MWGIKSIIECFVAVASLLAHHSLCDIISNPIVSVVDSTVDNNASTLSDGIKSFISDFNIITETLHKINVTKYSLHTQAMNSSQLIKHNGYKVEEHTINSNGYIMIAFRIPGDGPPVLILHGFVSCSDDFLALGSNSLPFLLADQGYDVWLGNARGNIYSRKNTVLSPSNPLFWDFSWHEVGTEDLPATIDYICDTTNVSKITYIGHSQGTISAYVMLSEKPEYNDKLLGVVSLASISYISNAKSPVLQLVAKLRPEVEIAFEALGIFEIGPRRPPFTYLASLCASSKFFSTLCSTVYFTLFGFDYDQIDNEKIGKQLIHYPSGGSLKQLLHFLQNVNSALFQKFDYGIAENIVKYESTTAPCYKAENIRTNMSFICGKNDWLSDYAGDVTRLIARLIKSPEVVQVALPSFNHMDFLWAKDAYPLVYAPVLEIVKKYTS